MVRKLFLIPRKGCDFYYDNGDSYSHKVMHWLPQNKNHQGIKIRVGPNFDHQYGNACNGSLGMSLRHVGFK